MRKFFLSSSTVITALLIGIFSTYGADKTGYFGRLLSSWDIDVYTLNENTKTNEWELPINNSDDFLLLTTSQMALLELDLNTLLNYDKVILVCDATIELSKELSCSFDNISTVYQKIELAADKTNSLLNISLEGTNLIVIPEAGFVLPKNTGETTAYFEALAISRENKKQGDNPVSKDDVPETQSVITENFELISYLVFLLFFNLAVGALIKKLNYMSLETLTTIYYKQMDELRRLIRIYKPLSKYLIALGICANLGIGILFVLGDGLELLMGAFKVFFSSPTLANIADLEILHSKYALALAINNALLVGAISPMVIEKIASHLNTIVLVPLHKLQKDIAKWTLVALSIMGSTIAATGTLIETHHIVIALLLLMIYILLISHEFSFTFTEKVLSVCIIAAITICAPLYNYYSREISTYTTEEALFNDSAKIIALPYSKTVNKNTKMKEFIFKAEFPIFVEHQLVYHPEYTTIINKSAKNISLTDNYMILTRGKNDYIRTLLEAPILLKHVETTSISELFYIDNNIMQTDNVGVIMTIDCTEDTSAKEIYLEKHKLATDSEQFNLLIFPGCTPSQKELTYKAPIDTRYMQQPGIFQIQNFSKVKFREITLQVNDEKVDLNYIKEPKDYQILGTERKNPSSTDLYVYSRETKEDKTYTSTSRDVNISALVNDAVDAMKLDSNFVMWSSAENAIIKNVH